MHCFKWNVFFLPVRVSDFHQTALCFLIRILSYDPKYKDVFREVGVLEVLTNCLKQQVDALKEKCDGMRVHRVYSFIVYVQKSIITWQFVWAINAVLIKKLNAKKFLNHIL